MRTCLVIAITVVLALLAGCQKDGVFPKDPPTVDLEVEWIPPRSFILTGHTDEPCDRGFLISGRQGGKIGNSDIVVLPYDIAGTGHYTKEITLTAGVKVYIRAWATRGNVEYTSYSVEQSYETW